MSEISRREFTAQALGSLLSYSLLETVCRSEALAAEVQPIAARWIADLDQLAQDVRGQTLRQVEWQQKVEELYRQIELPELLKFLDFERLTKNLEHVERGARSLRFEFPEVEGLPKRLVFGKQIFAMTKGRSVVPHGHNNMATAFLVLKGNLHGRHYDRIEDHPNFCIIKPTIDRSFAAGESSTVSDYKDNVHWFQATSDEAYLFNIHVLNVESGSRLPTGRVYLNPNGTPLAGGLVEAPRLGYQQAHDLFG